MIFEIINMSDAYTLKSDDKEAACVAVSLLGEGHYGMDEIGGDFKMPIFMFGGHDEFFNKEFGHTFEESAKIYQGEKLPLLIEALESVLIGKASDRDIFESGINLIEGEDNKKKWADKWHDKKRSSMNDIGKYARSLVKACKKLK